MAEQRTKNRPKQVSGKVVDNTQAARLEKRRSKLEEDFAPLDREARKASKVTPNNAEAEFKAEYDRMLRYNSRLIRRFNRQLQDNLTSRDVYALSTLMSQQREVINDLRTISDMSQQVGMLYDQAVTPFMSDTTQLITDVYYQLRKLLMETSKPKETQFALGQLDDLIKQVGIGLQTSHALLRQTVERILVGNQNTVKQPQRNKKVRA